MLFKVDMTREELLKILRKSSYLKNPLLKEAFSMIDRKNFVPPEEAAHAYENRPLSIGYGQTISQPETVAFMMHHLDFSPGQTVLDVGAGSGWQTALLSYIASKRPAPRPAVYAVERIRELCVCAQKNIDRYGFIVNGVATLTCQDATKELFHGKKFDRIIAAASPSENIPPWWRVALAVGGKIVAPIGHAIWVLEKAGTKKWKETAYSGFLFVPLISGDKNHKF